MEHRLLRMESDTILEAFEAHMPKTYEQLLAIQSGGELQEHYPQCDKISIDYGIMEKVNPQQVRIIPADLGWSDIGTWASLHEELTHHPKENLIKGKVTALQCEGCLIYNETDEELCVHGLSNAVLVKTKDFVLNCSMQASRELKKLLKARHETN